MVFNSRASVLFFCLYAITFVGVSQTWALAVSRSKSSTSTRKFSMKNSETKLSDDLPRVGIIIVDHGSRVPEANQMLIDLVEKYKTRYGHAIVEGAHMEMASPSIADAFRSCVSQGASEIICHPYFLSRGRHVREDVPRLMEEAAIEHERKVPYSITEPLGLQDKILELIDASIFPPR